MNKSLFYIRNVEIKEFYAIMLPWIKAKKEKIFDLSIWLLHLNDFRRCIGLQVFLFFIIILDVVGRTLREIGNSSKIRYPISEFNKQK